MSGSFGRAGGLITLLTWGVAHAQDVSPEDLQAREAAAPAPPAATGAPAQTLLPDISLIFDVAGTWSSEDDDPGFGLGELELSLAKSVDPYFRLDANLVFSPDGVEIEEAYGTTLVLPARLQARFGKFLTHFGRLNSTHPHSWDFVDRPFAFERVFGEEGNNGVGAELSWLAPLPWSVEAWASVIQREDDLLEVMLALKQFFPLGDDLSLLLGLSYARAPDEPTAIYGVDLYLKYRPITSGSYTQISLQSEWLLRRHHEAGEVISDVSGYAQLAWRFTRRWGTALRGELGTGETRQRGSAQLTFWPTEFSRLRLQGSIDHTEGDPVVALFLACELVIGAHGAHKF